MDKLTDSQIKKDLECCISGDCDNCYYDEMTACNEYMKQDALDLINRQDEENESLKAEVERLQNAYKQCAWERDIFAEDMKEEIKKDCSYLMLDIKTIKAEAYKEFAERLKREKATGMNFLGKEHYSVNIEEIDNLLKEMVGEEK